MPFPLDTDHFGGPLTGLRRAAALAAAALMLVALAFPLWGMRMVAPQYPEGLQLHVYAYKLEGGKSAEVDDLAEINTLNHYIGMNELQASNFPELDILPLGIAGAALLALVAALRGRRGTLWGSLAIMSLVGGGGLISAYYRLYQYGHSLDPEAPVKIAPFTPVMIGTNQLANFTTTGAFHAGAYLLFLAGLIVTASLLMPLRSPPA